MQGESISTAGDSISTAKAVQYPTVLNSLRSTEPTLYGVKVSSTDAHAKCHFHSLSKITLTLLGLGEGEASLKINQNERENLFSLKCTSIEF